MKAAAVKLLIACSKLIAGVFVGLLALEIVLQTNPSLLLRGMGAPAPVDPKLSAQAYEVHTSDADLFYWQADLIQPIPPEKDPLEAVVHFQTDEFGFPNTAPLPEKVDLAILGRSFSMGAQTSNPWPRLIEQDYGYQTLNLSQAGSGIELKEVYLNKFGLLRHPKWVLVEILPSMDILGYTPHSPVITPDLTFPIIHTIGHKMIEQAQSSPGQAAIYPLSVEIPGHSVSLVFYHFYLEYLTVPAASLAQSNQWESYTQALLALAEDVQSHDMCLAVYYATIKGEVYFPLAESTGQLDPVLEHISAWDINAANDLALTDTTVTIAEMQTNASETRAVIAACAKEHKLVFIDPTPEMMAAALAGEQPFMHYDSHWSDIGHQIVADKVAEILNLNSCP